MDDRAPRRVFARATSAAETARRLESHLADVRTLRDRRERGEGGLEPPGTRALPLTVGAVGTAGYLASLQGGGVPVVALAAMPSSVMHGRRHGAPRHSRHRAHSRWAPAGAGSAGAARARPPDRRRNGAAGSMRGRSRGGSERPGRAAAAGRRPPEQDPRELPAAAAAAGARPHPRRSGSRRPGSRYRRRSDRERARPAASSSGIGAMAGLAARGLVVAGPVVRRRHRSCPAALAHPRPTSRPTRSAPSSPRRCIEDARPTAPDSRSEADVAATDAAVDTVRGGPADSPPRPKGDSASAAAGQQRRAGHRRSAEASRRTPEHPRRRPAPDARPARDGEPIRDAADRAPELPGGQPGHRREHLVLTPETEPDRTSRSP